MNTESVDCRLIDVPAHFRHGDNLKQPGDFHWLYNREEQITDILIYLPGNEGGTIAPIPIVRGQPASDPARWGWDGNEEKPTLQPSIWRNKGLESHRNEWHGNLVAGRLVSC